MIIILICIAALFALMIIWSFIEHQFITSTLYEVNTYKQTGSHVFVLLSDLHGCRYGAKNIRLKSIIDKAKPEFILIAGDMVTKYHERRYKVALDLMKYLTERYPVYYAPGNHEVKRIKDIESEENRILRGKYRKLLEECGVHYLENESEYITGNIRVTGLDLPHNEFYRKFWEKNHALPQDIEKCVGIRPEEDIFEILLAHNPEHFEGYAGWGADLTLSGHVHGGLMKLPVLGGVISPSLELFPKYDSGSFMMKSPNGAPRRMIISRGAGSHNPKLRYFNPPEIVVINLTETPWQPDKK